MDYVLGLFYFLPTIIAILRGKVNTVAIFILNVLVGWTFIGWVIAFIWSVKVDAIDIDRR